MFLLFYSYSTPYLCFPSLSVLSPTGMSDPSPPPGHPQGEDMRPNETRSSNARGGHNICHRNQNRCRGGSRSLYEDKQAEIKDHVYDVGGIRGGNDLFDKTTREITDFVS